MNRIAEFAKVSEEIFLESASGCLPDADPSALRDAYESLPLPRRATSGSAGYDFFSPVDVVLHPGETVTIPTGVRARIDEGWVLMIFPRSGLGFRYRLQLNNTVGVIDSDYWFSGNEGHIMVRLINDSREGKTLTLNRFDRFAQGVFLPFGITLSDQTENQRDGGFGSTG